MNKNSHELSLNVYLPLFRDFEMDADYWVTTF